MPSEADVRRIALELPETSEELWYGTPGYDNYPTVLVNLDAVDVDELRELIIESWRQKAPRKLRTAYDRGL